ncbi:hypothetical protein BaRGS_00020823 [Batillaria attramentaria]|uniref:Uncharacterized protein n=1 Tax=Batillaria attramentaria TaxID=370345 RepID=A0ABD0KLC9_9CAEN
MSAFNDLCRFTPARRWFPIFQASIASLHTKTPLPSSVPGNPVLRSLGPRHKIPTSPTVRFRILGGPRHVTDWSTVPGYKTSYFSDTNGLAENGYVTTQLVAVNARNLTSNTVESQIRLDDSAPGLSGEYIPLVIEYRTLSAKGNEEK